MKENCWWKYCTDCSKYNWCKRHVRDVILTWSSWKLQHMSPVKFVIKRILFQIFWHRFVTYLWNGRCIRVKYMMLFFLQFLQTLTRYMWRNVVSSRLCRRYLAVILVVMTMLWTASKYTHLRIDYGRSDAVQQGMRCACCDDVFRWLFCH